MTCQFYNTYALYKNDIYQGQYWWVQKRTNLTFLTMISALYNQTWAGTYATNNGQWRGTDHYTIQSSYIASNATNPGTCPKQPPEPPQCNRAYSVCCRGVAPWSTNSGVWGGICGYYPSNPSEIVGAKCITQPSTGCPSGSIPACCAAVYGSQCGLFTQCG